VLRPEGGVINVLFLCTGNSARSILAEAILNRRGAGRFAGFSAGSQPRGEVHPLALALLREKGHAVADLRSKSWDEFALSGAPRMDRIVTVCDNAAGEACPVWPGHPAKAHWGLPDPAVVHGSEAEQRRAFTDTYVALDRLIAELVAGA
jgi:arsenate reductase (thioredoxin)